MIIKFTQAVLISTFIFIQIWLANIDTSTRTLPPSFISADNMQLLSFGEPEIVAKLLSFWLLSFDSYSGKVNQFESFNYDYLSDWLGLIQTLDPLSDYPSLVAIGVFADTKNTANAKRMIRFINDLFLIAPNRRWRWQAQAVMAAKYRLRDLNLALELAQNLRLHTDSQLIPTWARDMEFLILQDIGEFEAASAIVLGLLESGAITDPNEVRFLTSKLKELETQTTP